MQLNNINTVCTGAQLCDFHLDNTINNHPYLVSETRNKILEYLNSARRNLKVQVFAHTISSQSKAEEFLKEFGFEMVKESHNYKYPDTSKYLRMWVRDMNDWDGAKYEKKEEPEVVNPFHVQAPEPVRRVRGDNTYSFEKVEGSITRVSRERVVTNDVSLFPVGRWVEIPDDIQECPEALRGHNVSTLLRRDRNPEERNATRFGRNWDWTLPIENPFRIIAVMRVD